MIGARVVCSRLMRVKGKGVMVLGDSFGSEMCFVPQQGVRLAL